MTGDDGTKTVSKQVTPEDVTTLVAAIDQLGWFTDDMYSTSHRRAPSATRTSPT